MWMSAGADICLHSAIYMSASVDIGLHSVILIYDILCGRVQMMIYLSSFCNKYVCKW